jgi:hypothetical protein
VTRRVHRVGEGSVMAKKPDIWDFLLVLGGAFIGA